MIASDSQKFDVQNAKALAVWLFSCLGLVFVMIMIGAITRLNEAGLSMVEWRPLIGGLPPLSEAEWNRVFDIYKQSPEFQKENFWMELSDFKQIFFWEWFHRLWGRLIGLAYGLPLLFFWMRGMIPTGHRLRCLGLFVLVVLQGIMGWYMVKSGLIDRPAVSHYRLAAHLSLAFLLAGLTLWQAMVFLGVRVQPDRVIWRFGLVCLGALVVTIIWGAFVAGLDAGLVYNEFPLMGGRFIPPEMGELSPFWLNFTENIPVIQFTHRWLAVSTALLFLLFWFLILKRGHLSLWFQLPGFMALLQVGLGITTLLSQVYLPMAVLHQAGAVLLLCFLVVVLFKTVPRTS